MRALATSLLAGGLALIASALFAPQDGSVGAGPGLRIQSVDRTNKGDRLIVPVTSIGKQQTPRKPAIEIPKMLVGCDPVFSPLAAQARANFPGRCAA